jgi:hypothetical protein
VAHQLGVHRDPVRLIPGAQHGHQNELLEFAQHRVRLDLFD